MTNANSNSDSWGYELGGPGRPGVPLDDPKNLAILKAFASSGQAGYLSTSEVCMCSLAFCRPDLLPAMYTSTDAWKRIDDEQLAAILEFTRGQT